MTLQIVDTPEGPITDTTSPPKKTELTFPKCPHRDEPVDFTLGPGFIIEEERNSQNATYHRLEQRLDDEVQSQEA